MSVMKKGIFALVSLTGLISMETLCVLSANISTPQNTGAVEVGISPDTCTQTRSIVWTAPFLVQDAPLADASAVGLKYANDLSYVIDLGFTLISPSFYYNGVKVAEGSVELADGSYDSIGYDQYIDDGYYKLLREATDSSGVEWYIVESTGTRIGNYTTPDGSVFNSLWLKKANCIATSTISLNTSDSTRQNIVRTALSLLGKGYAYGEAGPETFDCSGFVSYVMGLNGIVVPRTSADICLSAGTEIEEGVYALRPGDIVGRDGHVGIYIGNGYFVHSQDETTGVKVDLVWEYNKSNPFTNYRNVIGDAG